MKKAAVSVGQKYLVRVGKNIVPVLLQAPCAYGGWYGVNLNTHKNIRIKTAARLRGLAPPIKVPIDFKSRAAGEHEEGGNK